METFLSGNLDEVPVGGGVSRVFFFVCVFATMSAVSSARSHLPLRLPASSYDVFLGWNVLVGANTGGLEGLGAQLLILVGDEVDAEREIVDVRTLAAEVEDSDLGVWHTTVEARLGVRLVLAVAVATRWTTGHFDCVVGG